MRTLKPWIVLLLSTMMFQFTHGQDAESAASPAQADRSGFEVGDGPGDTNRNGNAQNSGQAQTDAPGAVARTGAPAAPQTIGLELGRRILATQKAIILDSNASLESKVAAYSVLSLIANQTNSVIKPEVEEFVYNQLTVNPKSVLAWRGATALSSEWKEGLVSILLTIQQNASGSLTEATTRSIANVVGNGRMDTGHQDLIINALTPPLTPKTYVLGKTPLTMSSGKISFATNSSFATTIDTTPIRDGSSRTQTAQRNFSGDDPAFPNENASAGATPPPKVLPSE